MPTYTDIISLAAANFRALTRLGLTSNDAIARVTAALPHLFPETITLDGVHLDEAEYERIAVTAAARA